MFYFSIHILRTTLFQAMSEKELPLCDTERGVLSNVIAHYDVVESQGRGNLHVHVFLCRALPSLELEEDNNSSTPNKKEIQ
jgi:hypothetical protein